MWRPWPSGGCRAKKQTKYNISFKSNNSVQRNLKTKKQTTDNGKKYLASGVYQSTSPHCGMKCASQTGTFSSIRFKEIISPLNKSAIANFSQHLLESGHTFGKFENILEVLHFNNETEHKNIIEKLYIYTDMVTH
jgi:hypothetical protein